MLYHVTLWTCCYWCNNIVYIHPRHIGLACSQWETSTNDKMMLYTLWRCLYPADGVNRSGSGDHLFISHPFADISLYLWDIYEMTLQVIRSQTHDGVCTIWPPGIVKDQDKTSSHLSIEELVLFSVISCVCCHMLLRQILLCWQYLKKGLEIG
jgi:hypothetical protein